MRGRTSTLATAASLHQLTSMSRVIAGALPPRAADLVREWAGLHRTELEANWERARRPQALEAIAPPL